ncbi:TPA: hypothetical protein ACH3X3_007086 [Trebouxia sp. C0006]
MAQAEGPKVSASHLALYRHEKCSNPGQLPANLAKGTSDQRRQQAKGKGYWQKLEAAGRRQQANESCRGKGKGNRQRHWQRHDATCMPTTPQRLE